MSVVDSISELKNAAFDQFGIPSGGFTNPFGEIIDGFKTGLEGAGVNLTSLKELSNSGSDPSITQYLTSAASWQLSSGIDPKGTLRGLLLSVNAYLVFYSLFYLIRLFKLFFYHKRPRSIGV
jgi:hypothetical protein